MSEPRYAIAINASMLDEHPTGVGVYTFNVINTLNMMYQGENQVLTVFTPTLEHLRPGIVARKLTNLLQSSRYGRIAALTRFAWNTCCYPFLSKGFRVLINPTTHGSLTAGNQIITIHDLLSLRYPDINAHQRFYFRHVLPYMIRKAKNVVVVSEATKADVMLFLKCPEEKITVIYNGYDETRFNTTRNNTQSIESTYAVKDYFLAVGPTYPHKNFELLLRAYQLLDEKTRTSHPLAIAGGKQPYLDYLKSLAKKMNLGENVKFLGYVPSKLMPALYQEAYALVFPSKYEGFGFPLLEAMACGCPVIAARSSSTPEVCGDAAAYFDPNDHLALTQCMREMADRSNLRTRLISEGIVQAGKFSWEKTGLAWKKLSDQFIRQNH